MMHPRLPIYRALAAMFLVLVLPLLLIAAAPARGAAAQDATAFPELTPETHVYDATGSSLSADQIKSLQSQIDQLEADGAHVVLYVRNLMATPEETLDQVEALQQAWVRVAGVDQDTAVAILINRNPDRENDARAGIFVGKTYNNGNVPEGEQRAIVDDKLIPPLRSGNVYGSFSGALTRLDSSIRNGPPRSAFERWADGRAGSVVPWLVAAVSLIGAALAAVRFANLDPDANLKDPPTTIRPGDLSPAMAGALTEGSPQASAVPATILDLATRGAIRIEPESDGRGVFSSPKIRLRLVDGGQVRNEVESAIWQDLQSRHEMGIVSSKELKKLGSAKVSTEVRDLLRAEMDRNGWRDPEHGKWSFIGVLALILAIGMLVLSIAIAIASADRLPFLGIGAAVVFGIAVLAMMGKDSPLSAAGQAAARPWKAYKEGITEAANDDSMDLDLNSALPDAMAMNMAPKMNDRVERAFKAGLGLAAFAATMGLATDRNRAVFPYWVTYTTAMGPSSTGSGAGGTVSGGGAGGGGGAAGST